MRDYPLFLSEREEELLKALGKHNENHKVAHQKFTTYNGTMNASTMRSHMTRIFQRYIQALEMMSEYYDVFGNRLIKHDSKLRAIQRRTTKRRRERRR